MVGYNAAILQSGRLRLKGGLGFFLWGALHGYYVPGFRNRLSLRLTWLWSWATRRRAALLLIEGPATPLHLDTADLPHRSQDWSNAVQGR